MSMNDFNKDLRERARREAEDFLKNDSEYRMGYIQAELPHPLTRNLSQTYQKNTAEGVRMLFSVDAEMASRAAQALASPEYADFAEAIRTTVQKNGRVIFSGCGSSGRLSMRLEQSWRNALEKLCKRYPQLEKELRAKTESVGNIMTGGDYAVIRAAESFEDSTRLGEAQAAEWNFTANDLLVGVTATGETTSILGSAIRALQDGAQVYMLICSDPSPLPEKMERARKVYPHPNCRTLSLPCGPMALTGSTRMQSSTLEQFAAAVALEWTLNDILRSLGVEEPLCSYKDFGAELARLTQSF